MPHHPARAPVINWGKITVYSPSLVAAKTTACGTLPASISVASWLSKDVETDILGAILARSGMSVAMGRATKVDIYTKRTVYLAA